ncbi:MAG: hypothetical protein ACYTG5_11100 [Planctomycetota bacterium]|jgi:hypothetical protein
MSAPEERKDEDREYALLLAAHANRELTADESRRLLDLAEQDPERQSEIAVMDRIHDSFASERKLRTELGEPVDLSEENDEGYRRLAAKAAEAEDVLRMRLLHPEHVLPRRRVRRLLWPVSVAAVLLAALCFWVFSGDSLGTGSDGPGLLGSKPGNQVLGPAALPRIHLSAELSRSRPVFSWLPSVGASRYGAFIENGEGVVLMRRSPELAGVTRWQLSSEELQTLEGHMAQSLSAGGLFLRIEGMDATGMKVASSGDLKIVLVD